MRHSSSRALDSRNCTEMRGAVNTDEERKLKKFGRPNQPRPQETKETKDLKQGTVAVKKCSQNVGSGYERKTTGSREAQGTLKNNSVKKLKLKVDLHQMENFIPRAENEKYNKWSKRTDYSYSHH